MSTAILMCVLFFAKVVDNALSTTKTILVQRNHSILAGIALAASNFIYLCITKNAMSNTTYTSASILIDLKKNRIRVHKTTLHDLGDPKYIQLLIHPQSMAVAIRCLDIPRSGEPHHKISYRQMKSDNSYEIYTGYGSLVLYQ